MFSIQFLLILLFAGTLAGIVLFYFKKIKEMKHIHIQKIQGIQQAILLHKTQLSYRDKGLLHYNFLKYNLDESLKAQPEIKLS